MSTPAQPTTIEMTPQQLREFAAGGQPQPQPAVPQPAPQPAPAPAPAPAPTAPAPAPAAAPANGQVTRLADGTMELRLPTGQVYKGANEMEVMTALANAQVNASQRITQLSDEAARFRAGLEAVTGRQQHTGDPTQPQPLQFDAAVYRELAAQDPQLAFQYQLGTLFGVTDINEVPRTVQKVLDNSTRYETQMAINQFRAMAPDFPGTQDSINKVIGFMKESNIPFNAENLNMVHQGLVRNTTHKYHYEPLQPGQMPPGMVPAAQPVPAVPAPAAAPAAPVYADPNPQGLYAFGPDGFGSRPLPAVPPPAPAAQPTAPAPAPAAAPVAYAYPPAPVPVATAGFPAMPTPAAVPMPAAPVGTPSAHVPTAELSADQINAMPKEQLRQYIEASLQR